MFASKVASYNDNRLLGTDTTTATDHYGHANPLFRQIAALSAVRRAQPALTRGVQKLRAAGDTPGLLAIPRFDPRTGREILLAFQIGRASCRDRECQLVTSSVVAVTIKKTENQ